jgi:hypothetical protein
MSPTNGSPHVFPANQEHAGVRAAVLIYFFSSLFLIVWILNLLLTTHDGSRPDLANLLVCGGTLPLALGTTWLLERLLKRYWPSGDQVMVDATAVRMQRGKELNEEIQWAEMPHLLFWFFTLSGFQRGGRERRVARNWVCLAAQIQQGQRHLIAYTYAPPRQAAAMHALIGSGSEFYEIVPKTVYTPSIGSRITPPTRPEIPASVLAGKDGLYWLAERNRWQDGLELTPADFEKLLGLINPHHVTRSQ